MRGYGFEQQLEKALPDEKEAIEILNRYEGFENFQHREGAEHPADAYDPINDYWLELKVDYYKTHNHFIERFSNLAKKKYGGPWQYNKRGVKYYAFYYKEIEELYVFEIKSLLERLTELNESGIITKKNASKVKQNKDYVTYGYRVRKSLLRDVCVLHIDLVAERRKNG